MITDINVTKASFALPRIDVPENAKQADNGDIVFDIKTSAGDVSVSGFWRWSCKGTIESLLICRLIRPEWLPGIAGNNKVRQTVVFDDGGQAILLGPHRGKKTKEPHIIINRVSKSLYEVLVPPTKAQEPILTAVREKEASKMRQRIFNNSVSRDRTMSKAEIKNECISLVNSCHRLIMARIESSKFRVDAGIERKLKDLVVNVSQCISESELRDMFDEHKNVIRFCHAK